MKIALGSDHRGYPVKEAVKRHLLAAGHEIKDFGCFSETSANKVPDIRCSLCTDCYYARIAREHNDANVLAFGCRTPVDEALRIVDTWLETPFEGGRHSPRLEMISHLEQERMGRSH